MFGLWNELFGFPIDNCSYESIECNKTYIPLLNWDKDNEYMWTLVEPYGEWSLDAANITFNTKNIQNWPAEVTRVDEALNHLAQAVKDSYSTLQSFEFALDEDGESLKWTITYLDDKWDEYSKEATINLKDIIESFDELNLKDVTVESLEVTWDAVFKWATSFEWDMEFEWDLTIDWKLTAEDSEIKNLTVTESLDSQWTTQVNTINSTGKATLNSLEVQGNTVLDWTLEVKEAATLDKTMRVKWTSQFDHSATFNEDVDIMRNLHVRWAWTFDHSVSVAQDLSVNWTTNSWTINATNGTFQNLTINGTLSLGNNASAPQFILQREKWAANWVCPLWPDGKVPQQYLPDYLPTCSIHVWTWKFTWSNTCVIEDNLIKSNSYVNISNYEDIIWDLTETINDWWIIVKSNFAEEIWSFRYICATPLY